MRIDYDPSLVEQAVRLAVRRDGKHEADLHAWIDSLYRIDDSEMRDRAFAAASGEWFRRLGLDVFLPSLLAERPLIGERCARCFVCEAAKKSVESAELFVRDAKVADSSAERTIVVQISAESLANSQQAAPLFRRELLHISDMLDDAFAFCPHDLASLPRLEQIIRERYRVLWDLYVESRLVREGILDGCGFARLRKLFDRAFTRRGVPPTDAEFEAARVIANATHARLLMLARDPDPLHCDLAVGSIPADRTSCSLCGFPTFDWFDFGPDRESAGGLVDAVLAVRPDWALAARRVFDNVSRPLRLFAAQRRHAFTDPRVNHRVPRRSWGETGRW